MLTEETQTKRCPKCETEKTLLCNACNRAIGYLRDDPEIVLRAHAYLAG